MHCRICGEPLSNPIFELKGMPLTDGFVPVGKAIDEYIRDIRIFACRACGLVQNPMDFDHAGYYEAYEYTSGHSEFTRRFMLAYAKATMASFSAGSDRAPSSVLEIGSGDGEQLRAFVSLGIRDVLGIEPSDSLVEISEQASVPALKGLFSSSTLDAMGDRRFDICLSSYTLDHVRGPLDYLKTAHALLNQGGILAFEVHDFAKICERTEWCLFEHEHTIYMDEAMARRVVEGQGFEVLSVNPLDVQTVRANSLIVIARKSGLPAPSMPRAEPADYSNLQRRVDATIARIDDWVSALPADVRLVGYGAGGRGIMTLAALQRFARFEALFDSNYQTGRFLAPKTHIPVAGPESLESCKDARCMVFSFGYFAEISQTLVEHGFLRENIISLADFYE